MAKTKALLVVVAAMLALLALQTVTGPDHDRTVLVGGHYRKAIDVSAEERLMNDARLFSIRDMRWNVSSMRVEECENQSCVEMVVGLDGDTCVYGAGEDGMVTRQAVTDGTLIRIDGKNSETVRFSDIEGKIAEHLVGKLREKSGADLGSCS